MWTVDRVYCMFNAHGYDNGSGSGAAYVFERSNGVWSEQAKLTASDGAAAEMFGVSYYWCESR